jgi:hypothetical protein
MIAFHSVRPEIAQRETRCIHVLNQPNRTDDGSLSPGEYAFIEHYCEDLSCDCRRVFVQVIGRDRPNDVLASINYGWEKESFYRKRMPYDPDGPREIVNASLDPINDQSEYAEFLLEVFQEQVREESYRLRLKRHHRLFRDEVRRRQNMLVSSGDESTSSSADA